MAELMETQATSLTKAIHCGIPLGESTLDAYLLPSGEKRIGIEAAALALGYTERWFYNRTKRDSKWLKGLQATGFLGAQVEVSILKSETGESKRGGWMGKTFSLRDFVKLITYEAITKTNPNAIALLAAFAETGIDQILENAFAGKSIDFLLEKIAHFSTWTYEELEEVLHYNRQEVQALHEWSK